MWTGRGSAAGSANGHSRIALRMLERDPTSPWTAAGSCARSARRCIRLRREILKLDEVSNAWRWCTARATASAGLVVDRYDDLLVVEFFSAGAWRHRA